MLVNAIMGGILGGGAVWLAMDVFKLHRWLKLRRRKRERQERNDMREFIRRENRAGRENHRARDGFGRTWL